MRGGFYYKPVPGQHSEQFDKEQAYDNPTRTLECGCVVDDNQLLITGPDCEDPRHQRP